MKKYNTKLWVQNLDSIYQQALSSEPVKPFFLAIYDYVDYVLTTDTLAQLSDVFFIHKKSDYETADQYKKEIIEYVESIIPKLNKVKTEDFRHKENIKDIISIRKGSTQVMGDPEGWMSIFGHIEEMAWDSLKENETQEDILKLLEVTKHNGKKILEWPILEVQQKYKSEIERLERLRETRGWWAWEHFRLLYDLMNNYEGMRADVVHKQQWFQAMNLNVLQEEIKAVLKDVSYDQMWLFTYSSFLPYLHKVHRQLLNEIALFENLDEEMSTEKTKTSSFVPFTFNENKAVLTVNGQFVQFRKDTRKLLLLKLLIQNPDGLYYDEVVEELEGAVTDESMNTKNIYYEACRGIQMSMSKVGVTDFLTFNYSQAKINPQYRFQNN